MSLILGEGAIDVRRAAGGARLLAEYLHPDMIAVQPDHGGAVGVSVACRSTWPASSLLVAVGFFARSRLRRAAVSARCACLAPFMARYSGGMRATAESITASVNSGGQLRRHRVPCGSRERCSGIDGRVAAIPGGTRHRLAVSSGLNLTSCERSVARQPEGAPSKRTKAWSRSRGIGIQRKPSSSVLHFGPAPLVAMAIPVPEIDAKEAGPEELLRVHEVARLLPR